MCTVAPVAHRTSNLCLYTTVTFLWGCWPDNPVFYRRHDIKLQETRVPVPQNTSFLCYQVTGLLCLRCDARCSDLVVFRGYSPWDFHFSDLRTPTTIANDEQASSFLSCRGRGKSTYTLLKSSPECRNFEIHAFHLDHVFTCSPA